MITYKTGNLFDDDAQCLVNAVNAAGVMGAGIAREFKRRYPAYFVHYQMLCREGFLSAAGDVMLYNTHGGWPMYIINAATKTHWRDTSTLEAIATILHNLVSRMCLYDLMSIAMPALGCGLGGLSWSDVQPLIERILGDVDCDIRVYLPKEME